MKVYHDNLNLNIPKSYINSIDWHFKHTCTLRSFFLNINQVSDMVTKEIER